MIGYLEHFSRSLPMQPERDYQTKRGTPGIAFKFGVKCYHVTVQITGTDGPELPSEVASALALWSLDTLASKADRPQKT